LIEVIISFRLIKSWCNAILLSTDETRKEIMMVVFTGTARLWARVADRVKRARLARRMEALSPEARKDIGWPSTDYWNGNRTRMRDEMRFGGRTH
tara:strand:- start:749 stop:1033 length:285 start_codon:yes stop_codon:yes gene_type:complete